MKLRLINTRWRIPIKKILEITMENYIVIYCYTYIRENIGIICLVLNYN